MPDSGPGQYTPIAGRSSCRPNSAIGSLLILTVVLLAGVAWNGRESDSPLQPVKDSQTWVALHEADQRGLTSWIRWVGESGFRVVFVHGHSGHGGPHFAAIAVKDDASFSR